MWKEWNYVGTQGCKKKTYDHLDCNENTDPEKYISHGVNIMNQLLVPWKNSNRLVCADSYYSSVHAAEEFHANGFKFIGVVKTSTKKYPMKYLKQIELSVRGERFGLVRKKKYEHECDLLSFVWVDKNRKYFICYGSSMCEGQPFQRTRCRQVDPVDQNFEPEYMNFTVAQPKACEVYYTVCAAVDRHNRNIQDDLNLEKKIVTQDW